MPSRAIQLSSPSPITLSNYLTVFSHKTFLIELFNSMLYSAGAVAVALALGIPAGYAASRFSFPAKRPVMLLILATSMVPGVALLVPTFYVLDHLGLLNNRLVLVIILAARIAPQTVWFIQNFVEAVPVEIDGSRSHRWRESRTDPVKARVVLSYAPESRPSRSSARSRRGTTTSRSLCFAPDSAKRTPQVALVNQVFDAVGISWSFTMAFALISSLPVIVMFLVVQKWFIAGLTAGAVKG